MRVAPQLGMCKKHAQKLCYNRACRNKQGDDKLMKKIMIILLCIVGVLFAGNRSSTVIASQKPVLLSNKPITKTEKTKKKFRFYDEQSKKWYYTRLKKNIKRHPYDWSRLVNKKKKNRIEYQDEIYTIRRGIDVYYRNGIINWKKVKKAGIEFAFIRLGYRGYAHKGRLLLDKYFYRNLREARRAGIEVGVYLFSQAVNRQEALQEANFVLKTLHGTKLDLPIVYDPERILGKRARTDGVSGKQFTENTLTFCKKIEKAGYEAMIYSNMYWMAYKFDLKKLEKYPIWYADYRKKPQTPYNFMFWQYSASGKVNGVPTKVDLNVQFIPQERGEEILSKP